MKLTPNGESLTAILTEQEAGALKGTYLEKVAKLALAGKASEASELDMRLSELRTDDPTIVENIPVVTIPHIADDLRKFQTDTNDEAKKLQQSIWATYRGTDTVTRIRLGRVVETMIMVLEPEIAVQKFASQLDGLGELTSTVMVETNLIPSIYKELPLALPQPASLQPSE